jgi:septal ring factor EnvC (AmiA/AmiB activator)
LKLCAAFVAAWALLLWTSAPIAAEKEDLRATRQRLEKLRKDIAQTQGSQNEAADALRASESAISDSNRKLRALKADQLAAEQALRQLSAQSEHLRAGLRQREQTLSKLLYGRYVGGESPALQALLSGVDPGAGSRALVYQSYIARAHAELIEGLRADLRQQQTLETSAREKRAELENLAKAQADERQALLAQVAQRRAVLAKLSKQIHRQKHEAEVAQKDEARLSRLVKKLAEARPRPQARTKPAKPHKRNERLPEETLDDSVFARLKGHLHLPVRGELSGRFGTPRQDSGLRSKGIFISAAEGTEVHAIAGGQVVFADWMRGFGNLLIIDHGAGYMSVSGKNETNLHQSGDEVHAGDVIATVGASGGNEVSGLYFEMRHQGQAFDPLTWASLQ